jgi:signal transduction histidine kinase
MTKSLKEIAGDIRVKAGYTTAFIILLISSLFTLYGNNQLINQTAWVNNTNKVINNLETLVSGIKDAETGLRGYINTRDTAFLAPYNNSFAVVNSSFRTLKKDTENDAFQQKYLDTLSSIIRERYNRLAFAISSFRNNNYIINETMVKSFYKGKAVMDQIRSIVNTMQLYEEDLLTARNKELQDRYIALNIIIITSFIIATICALFGFYTYRRENKARLISDSKVADYQQELKQQIAELDKANAALVLMKRSEKFSATGRIARTIAHEVRNPLTNIDLAVAQIKTDISVQDESSNMLFDIVSRNSKRINQLISELLDATRFAELNFSTASINTLMDDALLLAKDRLELKQIRVEKKYAGDICHIAVDAEKVKIAFLNLIINAVEAMESRKGILQVQTRAEDDKCIVEITDNGHGMTEEELNKVFEPYFSTKSTGNGLGLTNTANIILNHKGEISVVSKPGEGTSFTIKFCFSSLQ